MLVQPRGRLRANYLRSAYPYQTSPAISIPDHSTNSAFGNAAELDGMVVDPVSGCEYAKPIFVPHNQTAVSVTGEDGVIVDENLFKQGELPDFSWDTIAITGTPIKVQDFKEAYYGHQGRNIVWSSADPPTGSNVLFTKEDMEEQGIIMSLSRTVYGKVPSGQESFWDLRWEVNSVIYSLRVSNREFPKFRISTDSGATYKEHSGAVKSGQPVAQIMANALPSQGQAPIAVEVLLLNRTMQVKLGSQVVPINITISDPGDPPIITSLWFEAGYFTQVEPQIHPVKFSIFGSRVSNPIALGFSPPAAPYYYVTGVTAVKRLTSGSSWEVTFPVASTVTVTRVGAIGDQEQQYLLEILNEIEGEYGGVEYAAQTAVVTRVTIQVDGVWASVPATPASLIPKSISLSTRFNPGNLTVSQSLSFTLNNQHGQWRGASGQIAISLELGYTDPVVALQPQFTGMCGKYHFSRRGHRGDITFECRDLMQMLSEQTIFNPPLVDGWNHYYAVAFFAQCAGFTTSQMAFASLVPSNPYSAMPGDTNPYFLPFGDGMRPWTPRNQEMPILSMLDYIRKPTGFMLFVDAQGYLRYEPWMPPQLSAQKKAFTEGATGSDGSNLSEYFQFQLTSSVDEVRNQIVMIGVDPYSPSWGLTLNKLEDSWSIYASPGSEPANYVGYRRPMVWVDPRFSNPAFAAEAAARLYRMLRIPNIDVSFTSWMQPTIYPMDVIYIDEHKSGSEGVPFYVMGTDTEWSVGESGHVSSTTSIQGRFLIA